MRQSWETMTSVSAGHIILTPTQPVGSGRPQRESNQGPPHQSSSLPTELPRPPVVVVVAAVVVFLVDPTKNNPSVEKGGIADQILEVLLIDIVSVYLIEVTDCLSQKVNCLPLSFPLHDGQLLNQNIFQPCRKCLFLVCLVS